MKKIIILLPLICLLVSITIYSQEEFVRTPAKFITKFHFTQLTDGIIIIKGLLDDFPDTLNFVLDTGSSSISLDSITTVKLHLIKQKTNFTVKGIGGIKNVDFTYNHTLHLSNLPVENLNFHISDYDILSSVYGIKIDGIIGASFFKRYIVKINYDNFTIEIFTVGYMKYPKGGYILHPTFQSLPGIKQYIKDEKEAEVNFIIDCGAGLNALLSQDFIDEHYVLAKNKKFFTTLNEGVGGKIKMDLTVIKSVQFGPYHFKKVPVYIFNDETNITDYPLYGGLIGNNLMRRFNVILNYTDGIFYYKPNTHFNDAFDYSYIGFNLYDINGEIRVMDLIPGAPGDKAGLKENDILWGMGTVYTAGLNTDSTMQKNDKNEKNNLNTNNKTYLIKDVQTYKNILQNTGTTLKLFIIRNGIFLQVNLKVHNILRKK